MFVHFASKRSLSFCSNPCSSNVVEPPSCQRFMRAAGSPSASREDSNETDCFCDCGRSPCACGRIRYVASCADRPASDQRHRQPRSSDPGAVLALASPMVVAASSPMVVASSPMVVVAPLLKRPRAHRLQRGFPASEARFGNMLVVWLPLPSRASASLRSRSGKGRRSTPSAIRRSTALIVVRQSAPPRSRNHSTATRRTEAARRRRARPVRRRTRGPSATNQAPPRNAASGCRCARSTGHERCQLRPGSRRTWARTKAPGYRC